MEIIVVVGVIAIIGFVVFKFIRNKTKDRTPDISTSNSEYITKTGAVWCANTQAWKKDE